MSRSFFGKKEDKQKNEKQGVTKEVTPRKTQRKEEEEEEEDNDSMITQQKVKAKRRRMLDDSDEEDVAMETNKADVLSDTKSNDELSQNEATPTNHTSRVCRPAKLDIKTPPKRNTGM